MRLLLEALGLGILIGAAIVLVFGWVTVPPRSRGDNAEAEPVGNSGRARGRLEDFRRGEDPGLVPPTRVASPLRIRSDEHYWRPHHEDR